MVEVLVVLAVTIAGFLLFFLAFLIKRRPKGEPVELKTCARCTCNRTADPSAARGKCEHR
ncbi:MAG: hypothetical protein MUD16_08140 [Desulfobacterales bacterium]|jgi:hypothetical protein|nr:hypothetical protein [Desulfobacterales bacterium]